jgi:hypothetical protein
LPALYRFELEKDTQVTVAWTPSWVLGGKALKVLPGLENPWREAMIALTLS